MTVTHLKAHRFLFYQMHRMKYKRGGKKRKHGEEEPESAFTLSNFEEVENKFTSITEDPEAPLGFDQFNTYVSAVRGIHARQVATEGSTCIWEQINFDVKAMKELVHKRKPRIAKAGFFEKIDKEFLPYLVVKAIPDIEKKLWERNAHSTNEAQAIVGLRDRFTFLLTLHAILRGESVYKAEALQHINYIQKGPTRKPRRSPTASV
jgi:hypothetical protein